MRYVGLTRKRNEPVHMGRHYVEAESDAAAWAVIRENLPSDWEIVWVHEDTPVAHLTNGHLQ